MKGFSRWLEGSLATIVTNSAMLAGLVIGLLLQNEFSRVVGSVENGAWLIKIMVIPAIVIFAIVANMETMTKSDLPARFFASLAGGFEIGLLILAWRILLHWYRHPDNPHMEPLFVATGVALAVLEWSRSNLKNTK